MRHQQQSLATIVIFGGNTVVSYALSILLKGVGYDTKHLEGNPADFADRLLDGADVMLLAPSLSNGACSTLLRIIRGNPKTAHTPVLTLYAVIGEVLEAECGTLLVPWPCPIAVLAQQIEAILDSDAKECGVALGPQRISRIAHVSISGHLSESCSSHAAASKRISRLGVLPPSPRGSGAPGWRAASLISSSRDSSSRCTRTRRPKHYVSTEDTRCASPATTNPVTTSPSHRMFPTRCLRHSPPGIRQYRSS